MSIFKLDPLTNIIHISTFETCLETGRSRKEITKLYPKRENGAYYIDKFLNHLKNETGLGLREYCKKHFDFNWPKCSVKKVDLGFNITGRGVEISRYARGAINKDSNESFRKSCERMSEKRKGEGNPMFGKKAWNSGIGLEDPRIEEIARKRRGKITPENVKKKQSESAKKRKIHGHTGRMHSDENKEKFRINTARLWAEGSFNRTTSIHIKVREFLKTLNLKSDWVEEFQVKYFSFDFAFPDVKIAIEVQGTFFHIDPRVYPDGPICAIQRRNFGRDKAKKKVCEDQEGWKIIEAWEKEINNGEFEEILLCKLRELNLLEK